MPPDEDVIEVAFSAAAGSRIDKLAAKIGERSVVSPATPHSGTCRAPAGAWTLRWQINGNRRGTYHLKVVVNGQQQYDGDIPFDEFGVDNGEYPF